jgi:hypothetical protein
MRLVEPFTYCRLLVLAIIVSVSTGCSLSPNSTGSGDGGGSGGSGAHRVSLTWKASTSNDVVGYNVYRGTIPGSYGLLNSMNTGTSYDDISVQNGQTYFYVVTAINSAGAESSYSNQTQAVIP